MVRCAVDECSLIFSLFDASCTGAIIELYGIMPQASLLVRLCSITANLGGMHCLPYILQTDRARKWTVHCLETLDH